MFSFPVPKGCPGHMRAVPRGHRPRGTARGWPEQPEGTWKENMVHTEPFLCTYRLILYCGAYSGGAYSGGADCGRADCGRAYCGGGS